MTVIQRTPNLGIGIRLQRVQQIEAEARPAAPGGCDVDGVRWLLQPDYVDWGDGEVGWILPTVRTREAIALDGDGYLVFGGNRGPDFLHVNIAIQDRDFPVVLAAVATGPKTRTVEWRVERSGSRAFQIDIDAQAHALITIPLELENDEYGYENITLTAHCGSSVVGTLRLQVAFGSEPY